MENKDFLNRLNRPTTLQIQYMEELRKMTKKRGAVACIAQICGVNHASVSRFFKSCLEVGYINKKYELTEDGNIWLDKYLEIREGLEQHFRRMGIPECDIEANVKIMMESMDVHVLSLMIAQSNQPKSDGGEYEQYQKREMNRKSLENIMEKGKYKVEFKLMKYKKNHDKRSSRICHEISMADRGFIKPAVLNYNNRGCYLELTLCDMNAQSRIDGQIMTGHLSSLKYLQSDIIQKAEIRNEKVRIPLDACHYHLRSEGGMTGMIPLTVTCSVGRTHMPESTAMLIFWI